jgi:WD40 repeat protein
MSNQNQVGVESEKDSSFPTRSAGGWNSVAGMVGMTLAGFFLFWTCPGPPETIANEPVVESRLVIRWRQNPVYGLAWSPDNRRLAASCFGPVIRVWDRESGTVSSHEGGTEQPRFALGWSDDGRHLMVSGLDQPIESWDLFNERAEGTAVVIRPLDQSASTEALIRSTGARPIRIWGRDDKRFGLLAKVGQSANSIAFSADGQYLATGDVGGRLEVHDTASGEIRWKIEVDRRGISAVSFSPDSSKVASSGPGPVRVWDVESSQEIHRLGGERSGSATLGFSPDGSKIAVATWDGSITVWDLETGVPAMKFQGNHGQILSLAWSPDGKTLASGGYDSTVRVWELASASLKTESR